MIIGKWNYKTHSYDDYSIPKNWNVKLFTTDMDEIVNCASCGKELKFGDAYTSKEIHNKFGLGFAVCEECYNKEWIRIREIKMTNEYYKQDLCDSENGCKLYNPLATQGQCEYYNQWCELVKELEVYKRALELACVDLSLYEDITSANIKIKCFIDQARKELEK